MKDEEIDVGDGDTIHITLLENGETRMEFRSGGHVDMTTNDVRELIKVLSKFAERG